jgi:hypothetical protein
LLLHAHVCGSGHHLSLVMNGVRQNEEGQLWVPAVFQMVQLVYMNKEEAINAMPTIILVFHVHFCHRGHHLLLVMNGVKVTA